MNLSFFTQAFKRKSPPQNFYSVTLASPPLATIPRHRRTITVTGFPALHPYVEVSADNESYYQKFPAPSVGTALRRYFSLINTYLQDGWEEESPTPPQPTIPFPHD